jgi:hypothetical protein
MRSTAVVLAYRAPRRRIETVTLGHPTDAAEMLIPRIARRTPQRHAFQATWAVVGRKATCLALTSHTRTVKTIVVLLARPRWLADAAEAYLGRGARAITRQALVDADEGRIREGTGALLSCAAMVVSTANDSTQVVDTRTSLTTVLVFIAEGSCAAFAHQVADVPLCASRTLGYCGV